MHKKGILKFDDKEIHNSQDEETTIVPCTMIIDGESGVCNQGRTASNFIAKG